jgi:hypothetical protein
LSRFAKRRTAASAKNAIEPISRAPSGPTAHPPPLLEPPPEELLLELLAPASFAKQRKQSYVIVPPPGCGREQLVLVHTPAWFALGPAFVQLWPAVLQVSGGATSARALGATKKTNARTASARRIMRRS